MPTTEKAIAMKILCLCLSLYFPYCEARTYSMSLKYALFYTSYLSDSSFFLEE